MAVIGTTVYGIMSHRGAAGSLPVEMPVGNGGGGQSGRTSDYKDFEKYEFEAKLGCPLSKDRDCFHCPFPECSVSDDRLKKYLIQKRKEKDAVHLQ